MELDRIDREILAALQKNARITNKELAQAVHLAPSSSHGRLKRLMEEGVVRGFHADVEAKALGVFLEVMLAIRLKSHSTEQTAAFEQHLDGLDEVLDVFHVAGAVDVLLRVAVRDVDHLNQLVRDSIASRPEILNIETSLIFSHRRNRRGYPDFTD